MLKRSILKEIRTGNERILEGAGIGRDAAVMQCDGAGVYATATVTLGNGQWGWIGVHRVMNDIAAKGGKMEGILVNITMPEKFDEKVLKAIMRQTEEVCALYGIQIAGGHTEIYRGVNVPIVTYTGLGRRICEISGKVQPQQQVIVTKWIGMEGSYLVYEEHRDELLSRFSPNLLEFVANTRRFISVAEEAELAAKHGACYLHNLSNGGILNGLWELSVYGKVGLDIDFKKIPLRQEIIEVCEFMELNPYRLLSGGSLLITAPMDADIVSVLSKAQIPAVVIGETTDSNDKILHNEDEIRFLDVQGRDDLWSLLDGKKI
ncbi:MAG: AIR synthase related protein [Lachnospiraceae bacterium]